MPVDVRCARPTPVASSCGCCSVVDGRGGPARVRADDRRPARPPRDAAARPSRSTCPTGFEVLVVGAGVVGLCAAIKLAARRHPVHRHREEHAPSAARGGTTAIPAPASTRRTTSTRSRSPRTTGRCTSRCATSCTSTSSTSPTDFGLRRHIRFGTEVDAAGYDDDDQRWDVDRALRRRRRSRPPTPNVVISAIGIFNPLKCPDIPGLDRFAGPRPHTARVAGRPRPHRQARRA